MSFKRIANIAASLSLVAAGAANANLINNGSFESVAAGISGGDGRQVYIVGTNGSAISDWALEGTGDVYIHISPDIGNSIGQNFNFAQTGSQYLDLSGGLGGGYTGSHATISQSFSTTPLVAYDLTFFIGAAYSPMASINVQLNGASSILNQTLSATAPNTNISWTQVAYRFVADSSQTKLSFRDTSTFDDNNSFVDNVSINEVSAVPEPSAVLLFSIGVAALSLRRAVFRSGREEKLSGIA